MAAVGGRVGGEGGAGRAASSRSSSSFPAVMQRQVPAVLDWRCPRSISSTVVGHSCFATVTCTHSANCADDRRDSPGAVLGPVVDMPLIVQRHMHSSRLSRSSTSLSWRRGCPLVLTVQKTIVIPLMQSIDKVFDVTVGQIQQIPRVLSVRRQLRSRSCTRHFRSWTRSLTCPLCSTTYARG